MVDRTKQLVDTFDTVKPGESLTAVKAIITTDNGGDMKTRDAIALAFHDPANPGWFWLTFNGPMPAPLVHAMLEAFSKSGTEKVN